MSRPAGRRDPLRRVAVVGLVLLLTAACGRGEERRSVDTDSFMPSVIAAMRAEGSARMKMSFDAGPDSFSGTGEMVLHEGEQSDARFRATADGVGAFTFIVVDDRLWLAYDDLTDGQFFEVDVRNGSTYERDFAGVVDQLDPTRAYSHFEDAVESVEIRGEPRSFDGVPTRRHHVVVDTSRIKDLPELEALPPEQVPPYFSYEMFVDDQGLLRRAEYSVGGVSAVVSYSDFGSVDRIRAPRADQVTTDNPLAHLDAPA